MAIWSLTKERVDRLLKQMGDKQMEIDELIKKSKEDLWIKDLDDFMHEWETELADEKNRRKKIQGMKRRESAKLKTQAGGRKRKSEGTDDDDFSVKKPKAKKAVALKSNLLTEFIKPKPASKVAGKKATEKIVANSEAPDVWQTLDGASESDTQIVPKPAKKVPTKPPAEVSDSNDQAVRPTGRDRAARTARKPITYGISSDSEGSDGDFDVSKMVKGIGQPDSSAGGGASSNSRQLFSASLSRPGSSAGLAARKSFSRDRPMLDDDSADETDYTRLAPMSTGPATVTAKTTILSEDDSMDGLDGPATAPPVVPAATAVVSKKRGRPAGAKNAARTTKDNGPVVEPPKAKPSKKKTDDSTATKVKPASKPVEKKKQLTLSPAAKAYAAKQAKQTKTSTFDPDDDGDDDDDDGDDDVVVVKRRGKEEEDDVDKIADDMLSDEDDEDVIIAKPAAARPTRRAAAQTKKAWVVEDDSDDAMEDTMDFEDDDSD